MGKSPSVRKLSKTLTMNSCVKQESIMEIRGFEMNENETTINICGMKLKQNLEGNLFA